MFVHLLKTTDEEAQEMDERTKVLVSLGAATAANCVPCFEHFLGKAYSLGLDCAEIVQVADIADRVKRGAGIQMQGTIRSLVDIDESQDPAGPVRVPSQIPAAARLEAATNACRR